MPRGIIIKDNTTKETLLKIAEVGIFTMAALSSPYFLRKIIKQYFKNKIKERARKLRELQKRKLLDIEENRDGSVKVTLTHLGKKIIHQYKLDEMKLKKPTKWDGKWRVIIYDIPCKLKSASNAFRTKIKQLGLYRLQKSVWIYPYDCISELEFLCAIFEIPLENTVCYFQTNNLPKEQEIKKFFKL